MSRPVLIAGAGPVGLAAAAELPTLREAGIDVTTIGWFGLLAPAGTPEPILTRLERKAMAAIGDPAVAARTRETGSIPRAEGRAAFARFVAEEVPRMQAIVRAAGIVAD